MKRINVMITWLNGKKTFIGLAALAAYYMGLSFNWYNADPTVEGYILAWTGVGLVHKAVKS